jgi:predicted DNA-binding transcriptional regulator YafY
MRADRLLAMLLLLQSEGRVSAPKLAARLEVSERTVYRDVEALSTAGVPVYTERGRNGGVALLPGHRSDLARFSALNADEARALFALGGRSGLDDAALRSALLKLLAALPEEQRPHVRHGRERVVVDDVGWRRPPEELPQLAPVRDAVWADRRLRLRYRSSEDRQAREYTVDPYGLLQKAGVWYLIAAHRRGPRLFRISRVEAATPTGDPADRPADLDLEALWRRLRADLDAAPAAVPVTLLVRDPALSRVQRVSAAQLAGPAGEPEPARPGWARLVLPFRALGAARGVLLGFGTEVEILAPDELRAEFVATARAILRLYQDEGPPAGR